MMEFADPKSLDATALEAGPVFAPRFGPDGLVTAIAIEQGSNRMLMLAHMNADALALTLETGIAHYYSRSRGKIWKKGETSGELQTVHEVLTDCDQDAIQLIVTQTGRGAACHTGRKSCFYRRVELKDGQPTLVPTGDEPLFDPEEVYGR